MYIDMTDTVGAYLNFEMSVNEHAARD